VAQAEGGAVKTPQTHLFDHDPDAGTDTKGRRYCRCGVREDHPRHELPDVPEQREHRERYGETE
jgi:hypothetical protein